MHIFSSFVLFCCVFSVVSFCFTQVHQLLPRRVKKRRKVQGEDGSDQGWEEYFDYIFPEDEAAKPNLKLLAMAKMWKKNKDVGGDAEEEEKDEETTETDVETESRRIDVMADKDEDEENPDADDPTIANESSSSSSEDEEEEEEEESSKKAKRPRRSK